MYHNFTLWETWVSASPPQIETTMAFDNNWLFTGLFIPSTIMDPTITKNEYLISWKKTVFKESF